MREPGFSSGVNVVKSRIYCFYHILLQLVNPYYLPGAEANYAFFFFFVCTFYGQFVKDLIFRLFLRVTWNSEA